MLYLASSAQISYLKFPPSKMLMRLISDVMTLLDPSIFEMAAVLVLHVQSSWRCAPDDEDEMMILFLYEEDPDVVVADVLITAARFVYAPRKTRLITCASAWVCVQLELCSV